MTFCLELATLTIAYRRCGYHSEYVCYCCCCFPFSIVAVFVNDVTYMLAAGLLLLLLDDASCGCWLKCLCIYKHMYVVTYYMCMLKRSGKQSVLVGGAAKARKSVTAGGQLMGLPSHRVI